MLQPFERCAERTADWKLNSLTLSKPAASSRFPNASPIPAKSVTGFSPIGSATKFLCFCDVLDIFDFDAFRTCRWLNNRKIFTVSLHFRKYNTNFTVLLLSSQKRCPKESSIYECADFVKLFIQCQRMTQSCRLKRLNDVFKMTH